MIEHKVRAAMLVATLGVAGVVGLAVPAFAATTGYPGTTTTTTTTAPPVAHTGALGSKTNPIVVTTGSTVTIPIGNGSTTISIAGFAPGSTAKISVNGVTLSITITADAQGNLLVTFTITDPHMSINGSTPIPVNTGANSIALTGTAPSGAAVTKTFTVTIPSTAASTGTAGSSSSSSSGSLAFTGADIAATVVGGLLLLALGTLLVVFTRRRSSGQHSA
jgi:hypothetical protein